MTLARSDITPIRTPLVNKGVGEGWVRNPIKHTMLTKTTVQLMALGLVGSFAATAAAQDSGALIDALVRKGVLKDQEAEQIRTQLSRDYAANTPAGKLNLSSSVKELKLSGDVRVRGQYDSVQPQVGTAGETQRVRYRLRLRVNADYKVSDDFFAGFGLQSTQANDSGNQTMAGGTGAAGALPDQAGDYFQNYGAFINKAFVGWTPISGVTLIAGKQTNPFYTTDLVWDADINPTGFVQRVDLNKFLSLGGLELSVVAGQLVVYDNGESASSATNAGRDGFIYQTQLIASAEVFSGYKVTIAPGYLCTNNGAAAATGGIYSGGGGQAPWTSLAGAAGQASNTVGSKTLSGLSVILFPGDVSTTLGGLKTKFLWDFAYNTDAYKRDSLYTTVAKGLPGSIIPNKVDRAAWLVGVQVGENKKKGDWSAVANYRAVGAAAVDPNINDSDWALSATNMAGPKVGFMYNLGDATTIGATYYYADNLRSNLLYGGGSTTAIVSPNNSVQVLQLDISVKF
jgi:hypothetical protein